MKRIITILSVLAVISFSMVSFCAGDEGVNAKYLKAAENYAALQQNIKDIVSQEDTRRVKRAVYNITLQGFAVMEYSGLIEASTQTISGLIPTSSLAEIATLLYDDGILSLYDYAGSSIMVWSKDGYVSNMILTMTSF